MPFDCLKAGLRWRVSWILMVPAVIMSILFGARFVQPLVDHPPTLNSFRRLDEVVSPGGFLRFIVRPELFDASRCTGTLDRMFLDPIRVDGISMWEQMRPPIVGSPLLAMDIPAPPGDFWAPPTGSESHGAEEMGCGTARCYVAAVPLPRGAKPGHWGYLAVTSFDCGFWHGGLRVFQTGPIWFDVTADVK